MITRRCMSPDAIADEIVSGARLDDKAGEQWYAKEVARGHQAPGDGAVGLARPSVLEMVVAEHQAACAEANSVPEHPIRVDADPVTVTGLHDDFLAETVSDQWPRQSDLHAEAVADQPGALLDHTQCG